MAMGKTRRAITIHFPRFEGLRDANYARHKSGATLARFQLYLDTAKRLGYDIVRSGAVFSVYAKHPDPKVIPYDPWPQVNPLVDLVARSGLGLVCNIAANPWRDNWSQLAGFQGPNEEIWRWWNKEAGADTYDRWRQANWPNERRPPRALWPAMRLAYQAMIDEIIRRWQRAGRKSSELEFSFWQEPDGASGHDPRTGLQAGWDSAFHQMMNFMLVGDGALDFHECRLWSPAFASGEKQAFRLIHEAAESADPYWSRFGGLAYNLYRLDLGPTPDRWVEGMVKRAKQDGGAFRLKATHYGPKPLAIHEFGVTPFNLGRSSSDEVVGERLAQCEQALIETGLFEFVTVYSLNDDAANADSDPNIQWGFTTSNERPVADWYRRLQGYARAWGIDAYDVAPPSGRWL
jgi:hypothetical protein